MSTGQPFLALSVGHTRTTVAILDVDSIQVHTTFRSSEMTEIVQNVLECWKEIANDDAHVIMAASDEKTGALIAATIADQLSQEIWQIGEDIPPAIGQHLDPETITGVDRLLNAAAAWDFSNEACIIIDAGTCVTVDFVDGDGAFHGGAIAPGAVMQLQAMHDGTTSLPEVELERPLREAFGKNTAQAMLQGIYHGIRGMVRQLAEQYALRYGAYPRIIATGGDAELLFGDDELIEEIIPDLLLKGIAVSLRHTMATDDHA